MSNTTKGQDGLWWHVVNLPVPNVMVATHTDHVVDLPVANVMVATHTDHVVNLPVANVMVATHTDHGYGWVKPTVHLLQACLLGFPTKY